MFHTIQITRLAITGIVISMSIGTISGQSSPQGVGQACHRENGAPCVQAPKVIVHVPEPIVEFVDDNCNSCVKAPCKKRVREVVPTSIQLVALQPVAQSVMVQQAVAAPPPPQNHVLNFSVSIPDNSQDIASIFRARQSLAISGLRSQMEREFHNALSEHSQANFEAAMDMQTAHINSISKTLRAQAESQAARLQNIQSENQRKRSADFPSAQTAKEPSQDIMIKLDRLSVNLVNMATKLADLEGRMIECEKNKQPMQPTGPK